MKVPYKVILIANYKKDKQESMNRFVQVVFYELSKKNIPVEIWKPICLFGLLFNETNMGLGKWFGYIDKYILTPIVFILKITIQVIKNEHSVYHITDHSNAIYVPFLPKKNTLVTCHDVLAIRGAFGFKDAYCNASKFGVLLQKNIFNNLQKNINIAFVSINTQKQFLKLLKKPFQVEYKVVYNGLNAPFTKLSLAEKEEQILKYSSFPTQPFLLHVGSNLERKNRSLLLKMLENLQHNFNGIICFAGQKPDNALSSLIDKMGLAKRVIVFEKPSHELLNLLYNTCDAFIFPSFSEGFGWPIIEAQTCGVPVICSNIEPMPEVGGAAVLLANPNSANEFTTQFLKLKNQDFKADLIKKGFENANKFKTEYMIENYIQFYNKILKN